MQTAIKQTKKHNSADSYKFDQTMSMTKRIAHFLDWAALNMPKEFQSYNIVLKAVMGYKHLPRLDSKEVKFVQHAITRVRKVLLETYKRGTVTMPAVGVRATTDDADMVKHDVVKKGVRVQSAVASFTASVNIVNPANIPRTLEMTPYLKYIRDAKAIVSDIGSQDYIQRLLPPSTDKDAESK